MELLLNIVWLALALPALWMWHRVPARVHHPQWFGRCRPFLLLGCALVLLFPVVSATDDLHAMRPEMEESNSKRLLKHSTGTRSSAWTHPTGGLPSQFIVLSLSRNDDRCGLVFLASIPLPELAPLSQKDARAPPANSLS